ncbi:hypothetical protein M8C21_003983, partial [Ambrosia artemisiifolia]
SSPTGLSQHDDGSCGSWTGVDVISIVELLDECFSLKTSTRSVVLMSNVTLAEQDPSYLVTLLIRQIQE